MKKQLMIAGAAATIGLAGITGLGVASAETDTSSNGGPHTKLVEAIASKFNLNKDEVQKVVEEHRTAMETERQQKADEKLAKLVKDGKLTQAQADAIKEKRAELQKEREANKPSREEFENLSEEERKAKMEERRAEMKTKRAELESWAKEQGIDTKYLRYVMGGPGHGPGGHGMGPRSETK